MLINEKTASHSNSPTNFFNIVHIVPYDGIGGVEVAARSLPDSLYGNFRFVKCYLFERGSSGGDLSSQLNVPTRRDLDHPSVFLSAIRRLISLHPRVVIASLWRSCAVLVIYKILYPSTKVVTFLHSASDVHWVDRFFNRLAIRLSDEIWADSQATLDSRFPSYSCPTRVISFLIDRYSAWPSCDPKPSFVFWGRLNYQKGLFRALNLFLAIKRKSPDATFVVIGPDGGERSSLVAQINMLGLGDSVVLYNGLERSEIFEIAKNSSFYLQTSLVEGMAMSVVEAMQLGLVPVVTPVGEIASYCKDGHNAVLVIDDSVAVQKVLDLLQNYEYYNLLSNNAVETWRQARLYRDDVIEACRQLISDNLDGSMTCAD